MQVETSVGQVPIRVGSWNPDRTPGMETSTSSPAIKELTRLVWPEAIPASSHTCLVGTWGNISLIPLRAISMSIPDMYIHLPNTSQRSALDPWYPDQAGMKVFFNPIPGWYEVFEKSQYQYQLVCSKVDTHPTLGWKL